MKHSEREAQLREMREAAFRLNERARAVLDKRPSGHVTEKVVAAVTEKELVTKKRGRPKKAGGAMSGAERIRRMREKRKGSRDAAASG